MKNQKLSQILKRLWDYSIHNNNQENKEIVEDMAEVILQREHDDDGDDRNGTI